MLAAQISYELPRLTWTAVIDILAVALVLYQVLQIVRGTRAAHMLAGYHAPESTDEILLAISSLARDKVGALIVLERDAGLRTFVESGVRLDAHVSRDLLLSIFMPGTALHDGAVIIQKDRIAAAACFLPLSVRPEVTTRLGTRHRAGLGITEESDAMALIVSEETGAISIASAGEIEQGVTIERAEFRVRRHFGVKAAGTAGPARSPQASPAVDHTEEQREHERAVGR